jgi:hypothetical protein
MKTPVYLIEKETGLFDENGVELFYTVGGRLNRVTAEEEYENEIKAGAVRIRKIVATK